MFHAVFRTEPQGRDNGFAEKLPPRQQATVPSATTPQADSAPTVRSISPAGPSAVSTPSGPQHRAPAAKRAQNLTPPPGAAPPSTCSEPSHGGESTPSQTTCPSPCRAHVAVPATATSTKSPASPNGRGGPNPQQWTPPRTSSPQVRQRSASNAVRLPDGALSWPNVLSPQHLTPPSPTAQLCRAPAETSVNTPLGTVVRSSRSA